MQENLKHVEISSAKI